MLDPYYSADTLVPDQSVGYLIKRSGALMTQIAERTFESQPISFTQWVILMWLSDRPHGSPSELSAQIGHDMGALTRVVDSLERRGLARRQRSRRDRRAVEIAITPAGRRQALSAKRVLLELLNRLVGPFSHHEIDTLISLLQRLLLHLQEAVGPKPAAAFAVAPRLAVLDAPRRRRRKRSTAGKPPPGDSA